jgi:RNA polymerase sigma-70 factor (ECF subfamily)
VRERVRKILYHKRLGIPDYDRDDLEQEVMAELWRAVNRAGFDFTAGFWGFVEIVTSRRCIDWLRSRRGLVPVADNTQDQRKSPLDEVLDAERSEIAAHVLEALDPECRKIIIMRIHDGMPYQRIADILGKSVGAVRVQMYRCISHAQRLIHETDPAPRRKTEQGGPDGSS